MKYVTRRIPVQVSDGKPYYCGQQTVWNIEADKPGNALQDEIIVIGAHYDCKVATAHWHSDGPPLPKQLGTPGADDNSSGVAGLLAVARELRNQPLQRTVKFVAFVNEEPPFFQTQAMGSLVYAKQLAKECAQSKRKVIGMISFEMLGYYTLSQQRKRPFGMEVVGLPSQPDYIAFLGNWTSGDFSSVCGAIFDRCSTITVRVMRAPVFVKGIAWSDDWAFWQTGVPAFSATDTAFLRNDHYHSPTDTPDTLDYSIMANTVWGLRGVVEALANGTYAPRR